MLFCSTANRVGPLVLYVSVLALGSRKHSDIKCAGVFQLKAVFGGCTYERFTTTTTFQHNSAVVVVDSSEGETKLPDFVRWSSSAVKEYPRIGCSERQLQKRPLFLVIVIPRTAAWQNRTVQVSPGGGGRRLGRDLRNYRCGKVGDDACLLDVCAISQS